MVLVGMLLGALVVVAIIGLFLWANAPSQDGGGGTFIQEGPGTAYDDSQYGYEESGGGLTAP